MWLSLLFLLSFETFAKERISTTRLNQLSGDRSARSIQRSAWDRRYSKKSYIYGKSPARFLAENFSYIPVESKVLDMGMGEGRNAVFLAKKGHSVTGIDISSVAIKKAQSLATESAVQIKTIMASLDEYKIEKESFDTIICFYYVDRKLIPKMKKWLKPGGIIIFEAHNYKERRQKNHKRNPEAYYLKDAELLSLFSDMTILKYEEPVHEAEFRASIIVKKDKK